MCVSSVHITEINGWGSREWAVGFAKWIDRIPYIWTKANNVASIEELRHQIFAKMGLISGKYSPFTFSLLAAMDVGAEQSAADISALLADPTFTGFVTRNHGLIDRERARRASIRPIEALQIDRQSLPAGTTGQQVSDVVGYNFRVALRKDAYKFRHEATELGGELTLFFAAMDEIIMDETAIPLERIHQRVALYIADVAAKQLLGSRNVEKRFGSVLWDMEHLTGAAYSDVFTCDRFIDQAIGDFRVTRGQTRQLSAGAFSNHASFVEAIIENFNDCKRRLEPTKEAAASTAGETRVEAT